ncbi:MAG: DUF481 domain-containing protein [Verrucomicrobiota bacterium]
MKFQTRLTRLFCLIALFTGLRADEVITHDGSKLVGTISGITDGVLTLETEFAGTLAIPMDQVDTFRAEDPLTVRLESGETMTGTVSVDESESVEVIGTAGSLKAPKNEIRLTWLPGQQDPDIAALQRNWEYRAALDVTGSSGNTEKSSARISLEAELVGPDDRLKLSAQHESGENDGETTARETKVGARYTNFVSEKWGWFTRVSFENDKFEDLDLRVLGSGGISYRVFDKEHHYLATSAGLAYQYSDFSTGESEDLIGLDLGLIHHYEFENLVVTETEISYIPSFEDPADFRLEHSSWVQVPISGGGQWNIRAGIENTYVSEPEPGVDELDTLYFTSLVFTWN